jgi:hypothetical protein
LITALKHLYSIVFSERTHCCGLLSHLLMPPKGDRDARFAVNLWKTAASIAENAVINYFNVFDLSAGGRAD